MAKPVGNPDPGIPAVFVTQKTGITIKRLMTPGVTDALLTPVRTRILPSSLSWEFFLCPE